MVMINAKREEYNYDQIRHTMTVGELIRLLHDFNDYDLVYLSHDNGYTFGGLTEDDFQEWYDEDHDDRADIEIEPDLEVGFDPYMGCYSYDC